MSLAAQKFISDIANDALTHCKMRGTGQNSRKSGKVSNPLLQYSSWVTCSHNLHDDNHVLVFALTCVVFLTSM